jgi:hypothetical protein
VHYRVKWIGEKIVSLTKDQHLRRLLINRGFKMWILIILTYRLHQLLSEVVKGQRQHGFTVINTGRTSWAIYVYPAVGVGLVYAYCRSGYFFSYVIITFIMDL